MSLNTEQTAAMVAIQSGFNVFLTGAGGTGKSHTIQAIVSWARLRGLRYAITAMTGCAALLLGNGAKTLHSWAGVGLARESGPGLCEYVKRNKRAARRWIDTNLLILDEVSMMTPEFLEKLDCVARHIRRRPDTKFGGLQVVFTGDFAQLPPVNKEGGGGPIFAFESPLWPELIDVTVELVEIQRQRDPVFQKVLSEARMGRLSPESITVLEQRMGLDWQDHEIRPTLLFSRNADVDNVNTQNMAALTGERKIYKAQTIIESNIVRRGEFLGDSFRTQIIHADDPDVQIALERLDADAPYDNSVELCVGAQVMLLVNTDPGGGLVNGSRGVVKGYTAGGLPIVHFLDVDEPVVVDRAKWEPAEFEGIGRWQIPLKIAYAITIHKSQGSTLNSALIDIGSSTFEFGQAYVALSRVRTLAGLYVWKFDPRKVKAHPRVVAFYASLAAERERRKAELGVTAAQVRELMAATEAGTTEVGTIDEGTTDEGAEEATEAAGEDPVAIHAMDTAISLVPTAVPTIAPPVFWTLDDLSPEWLSVLTAALAKAPRLEMELAARVASGAAIQPAPHDVFAALRAVPDPSRVRVVFLGQDPYPTHGLPHGLAFSVRSSVARLPPSLVNIFKEVGTDLGVPPPTNGCLDRWASQGVLLLNDVLTVNVGAPESHAHIGWEEITAQILETVLRESGHVVVIAWGRNAQKKIDARGTAGLISTRGHTVLRSPHPSPLSAHRGFFGSRPFSQTNAALIAHCQAPIQWV